MRRATLLLSLFALVFVPCASADVISSTADFPPPGMQFSPDGVVTFQGAGTTAVISDLRLVDFSTQMLPPLNTNDAIVDPFSATMLGLFSVNGGPAAVFSAIAQLIVNVTKTGGTDGTPFGTFDTEIVALDLTGLPGGAQLQESPTDASKGKLTIAPDGGDFRISSFFDVFVELSLDPPGTPPDQRTWVPTVDPRFMTVKLSTPEPSVVGLVAFGLLGLAYGARRRR